MTADIELLWRLFWFIDIILRILLTATSIALLFISIIGCGLGACRLATSVLTLGFQNYSMHAINWSSCLVLAWKELFTADSTRNDVTDKWVSLWQVGSEVHLLPETEKKVKPIT